MTKLTHAVADALRQLVTIRSLTAPFTLAQTVCLKLLIAAGFAGCIFNTGVAVLIKAQPADSYSIESRLRTVEQNNAAQGAYIKDLHEADLRTRVTRMETSYIAMAKDVEVVQRQLWAIILAMLGGGAGGAFFVRMLKTDIKSLTSQSSKEE